MKYKKIDARTLSFQEREKLREKSIKQRENGQRNKEVSDKLGVPQATVSKWYKKYINNNLKELTRGRKIGEKKKLDANQELKVFTILQKEHNLLNKKLVKNLTEKLLFMHVPMSTINDYLKKWSLNSIQLKKFKNSLSIEKLQILNNYVKKQNGVMIWVKITDDIKITINKENLKFSTIITSLEKNKLVFKIYDKSIEVSEIMFFLNGIIASYPSTKKLFIRINPIRDILDEQIKAELSKLTGSRITLVL